MSKDITAKEVLERDGYMETMDPGLRRAFEFANEKVDPNLVDYSKVKMAKDSVLVSGDGTFYTLQGEGPTMGLPCVFVRLHMCNLQCSWCDAWYTWNPNTKEFWTEPRRVGFRDLALQIANTWDSSNTKSEKRVIYTGGEPLIQRNQLDEVHAYLEAETDEHWNWEIETNGTRMPTKWQIERAQFNCSPKLSNSDNMWHSQFKPKVLNVLTEIDSTTFKFVCMTEADLDEIEEHYAPHVDWDKIIIMPQGITEEEVSENAKVLAEPCKERGLRIMPRLQNILWHGARRAV